MPEDIVEPDNKQYFELNIQQAIFLACDHF